MSSRWSPRTWAPSVTGQRHFPGLGVVHFDPRAAREVEFIFHEIFDHADYLPPEVTLGGDAVILDVGANIGLFTLHVARVRAPGARVLAFEPVPRTFEYLTRNLAEHGLGERVRPFQVGLGRAPGTVELTHYPFLPGNSTADPAEKAEQFAQFLATLERTRPWAARLFGPSLRRQMDTREVVRAELSTVAEVIAREGLARVDLLKVDVEGAELDVLAGVGEAWPRVHHVVVETHERGDRVPALVGLLEGAGLEVTVARPRFTEQLAADNRVVHARRR